MYISGMFFTISIYSALTLTNLSAKTLAVSTEPNGNVSLLFHSRDCRKTQNNAAVDKVIVQSERTNLRFHHLAHHRLFPMNYLLAPLHLACPLDVVKPIKNL